MKEDNFGTPGEMIRLYFDEGESGHAFYLGNGLAMIDNHPITDKCSYKDVVSLTDLGEDRIPIVDKVTHKEHKHSQYVYFDMDHQWHELDIILTGIGCCVSGLFGPDDKGKRGVMLVAYNNEDLNPALLAEGYGIKNALVPDKPDPDQN